MARERKILRSKKQKTKQKTKGDWEEKPLSPVSSCAPLCERLEQDKRPIVKPATLQSSDRKIQPANPTPPRLLAWVLLSHVSLTNDGGAHFLFHILIFRTHPTPPPHFSSLAPI